MALIIPDPNERQLDDAAAYKVMMAEAERCANGERIVLARLVRRVITGYLNRTEGKPKPEYRWTEDTEGHLQNRDGLRICGDPSPNGDGARCVDGEDHTGRHYYRSSEVTR